MCRAAHTHTHTHARNSFAHLRDALVLVVRDDDGVGARRLRDLAAIARLRLNVADHGTLRDRRDRQNVADGELRRLAGVDELTGVRALRDDHQLIVLLKPVEVRELDLRQRRATSRLVDDVLNDSLHEALTLREIELAHLRLTLAVLGVRREDRDLPPIALALTLTADNFAHPACSRPHPLCLPGMCRLCGWRAIFVWTWRNSRTAVFVWTWRNFSFLDCHDCVITKRVVTVTYYISCFFFFLYFKLVGLHGGPHLNGAPQTRAHASARERTRVHASEPGWTRMDQDGPGWTRMDQDGPDWTRANESERERTRAAQGTATCRLARVFRFECHK